MAFTMRCLVIFVTLMALVDARVTRGVYDDDDRENTPIQKVVELLDDLKVEVEQDAENEATIYAVFATDCKEKTVLKTTAINTASGEIALQASYLEGDAALKATEEATLLANKVKKEGLSADLDTETTRCSTTLAAYTSSDNQLASAIEGLRKAFTIITESMPSLIQAPASYKVSKELKDALDMAEAMGMVTLPKHKAVASFLQLDGSDDNGGEDGGVAGAVKDRSFGFHSDDINELFRSLHATFVEQKRRADKAQVTNVNSCTALKASLGSSISTLTATTIPANEAEISRLEGTMGGHRTEIVKERDTLTENQLYLKDLTAECEARAKDWDQRTKMATDEVAAITTAHTFLTDEDTGVQQADHEVNMRAMLITPTKPKVALARALAKPKVSLVKTVVQPIKAKALAPAPVVAPVARKKVTLDESDFDVDADDFVTRPASFLQVKSTLRGSQSAGEPMRKAKALALVSAEGARLRSLTLITLAQSTAAEPFAKVKGLVDKLIQRLSQEAITETTKNGFCKTEVAKAELERSFRWTDTQELSADVDTQQAKEDAATTAIQELTTLKDDATDGLTEQLREGRETRKDEKEENAETVAKAQQGVIALKQAVATLRTFYNKAAKASFVQLSPILEDGQSSGGGGITAGFSGSSNGHQSASTAILGLLETIATDFDRTIRTTQASEIAAAKAWLTESDNIQKSIASTEKKIELTQLDKTAATAAIEVKMAALNTAQDLLDAAAKRIDVLKPMCIDTGMSYATRVQKRDAEIAALGRANCLLADPDADADPECATLLADSPDR